MRPELKLVHDETQGRVPPHDLDAEGALLHELMYDEKKLRLVRSFLQPEHFYSESHRRIYEAIVAVSAAGGGQVCVVRVGNWLKDNGRLAQVGGMEYVNQLRADYVRLGSVENNVLSYATIVYDKWRVRQLVVACQRVAAEGYLDYGAPQAFLEAAAGRLGVLARSVVGGPVESSAERLRRAIAELGGLTEGGTGRAQGIPTGIAAFDALTGGLRPRAKTTFAALTGVGKSVAALQASVSAARHGVGVLYFATEMTAGEVIFRTISHICGMWVPNVVQYGAPKGREPELQGAMAEATRLPIHVDDTEDLTPEKVRSITELWVERMPQVKGAPLGLVVVDYVQRLDPSPNLLKSSTVDQISYATKSLKRMAKELGIAVLELAQQRTPDRSKTGELATPTEQDIADCKKIGKEADVLTFFQRAGTGKDRTALTMFLVKQRNGKAGEERRIEFVPQFGRFETIDGEESSQ